MKTIEHKNFIFDELYNPGKRTTIVLFEPQSRCRDFTFDEIELAINEQAQAHREQLEEIKTNEII